MTDLQRLIDGFDAGELVRPFSGTSLVDLARAMASVCGVDDVPMTDAAFRTWVERYVVMPDEPEKPIVAKLEERTPLQGATFSSTGPEDKVKGVRITEIESGSPAQQSQLQEGDIITAVNRKAISTVEEFTAAMKSSPRSTVLAIKRGEEDRIVVVQ